MGRKILMVGNRSREMYIFRKGVISNLSENNHEVCVVAPEPDETAVSFFNKHGKYIPLGFNKKSRNPFSNISLCYKLYKIYKTEKPDLVFHYTIKPYIWGSFAAFLTGCKSVSVITGLGYTFMHKNLSTLIIRFLYRIALQFANSVWFLNNDDRSVFLSEKIIGPYKALTIPGEGINTEHFHPQPKSTTDQITRFLMIARLTADKGTKEYCEAAKMIKSKYQHVEFQLLGELNPDNVGSVNPEYIQDLHSAGIVNYVGTSMDVREKIKDADCLVLPSYREGIPRTLMEGASMQKTLIASNITGCNEVVLNNFNGFLCNVKSSADLAKKIEKFLALPKETKNQMGLNGRNYMVDKYEEKIVIRIYSEQIDALLTKSTPRMTRNPELTGAIT